MSDYSDRQAIELAKLENATGIIHDFANGPVDATVPTESGEVPTLANLVRQFTVAASGRRGYLTKADLDADLSPDAGFIAEVTNDPVFELNRQYVKVGASGTGSWLATTDRLIGVDRIIASASQLSTLGSSTYMRVHALGYNAPGDGGDAFYWCDTQDTVSPEDKGAVWLGPHGERWKLEMGPTIKGESFGVLPTAADIAVPLANAIKQASGRTLLMRRGTYALGSAIYSYVDNFSGSATIDFNGSRIEFSGIRTAGTEYDWYWGVLGFYGKPSGQVATTTLTAAVTRGASAWPLASVTGLTVGSYYVVTTNPTAAKFADHIVDKMARVAYIDAAAKTVDLDFIVGFDMPEGLDVSFTEIVPMRDVTVKNLTIEYTRAYQSPNGTDLDKQQAHSGIAFRYAVNCQTENFEYVRNPKQAVHHTYTIGCAARAITMTDPIETNSGGYCVQFERSHSGHVVDLLSWRERHVLDVTASSNIRAEKCRAYRTANASFTTHGAYEHDLTYDSCEGHFQLAGSGPDFGQCTRGVTVRNHTGSILNIQFASDVSITDSVFLSLANLNADGLVLKNVDFKKDMVFVQNSNIGTRENIVENCRLWFGGVPAFAGVTTKVTFRNCSTPNGIPAVTFDSRAVLVFEDCNVASVSAADSPVNCNLASLIIRGGSWKGTNLYFTGSADQYVEIGPVAVNQYNRPSDLAFLNIAKPGGTLRLAWRGGVSDTKGARHITAMTTGATLKVSIDQVTLKSGSIRIDQAAIGAGGWLRFHSNVYEAVTKAVPAAAANVVYNGEITL